MTAADFHRIALSLPGVEEGSHFGNPDFRVGGRIFATLALAEKGFGTLLLTPEQQQAMMADAPDLFSPAAGAWGRNGSTLVRLAAMTEDVLEGALRCAWTLRTAANTRKSAPRKRTKKS
jgi:hypothetical protein